MEHFKEVLNQHRLQTCNLLQFYYPSCNRPSEAEVIKTINMLKNANGGLLTKIKEVLISACVEYIGIRNRKYQEPMDID